MILIPCPSADCYWTTGVEEPVEASAASFVTHWRAKHEPPLGLSSESSDLVPIDGTFTSEQKKAAAPPAKKADRPGYSSVSVVRRTRSTEPELDDRGLTSGGRPPEEFWNEPDPYPKARRAKMTKRLPMGRRV